MCMHGHVSDDDGDHCAGHDPAHDDYGADLSPLESEMFRQLLDARPSWQTLRWDRLTATEQAAIHRLVLAGLLEAKVTGRLLAKHEDAAVEVRAVVSGGYQRHLQRRLFDQVPEWIDEKHRLTKAVAMRLDYSHVRLSRHGETAQADFSGAQRGTPQFSHVVRWVCAFAEEGVKGAEVTVAVESERKGTKEQVMPPEPTDAVDWTGPVLQTAPAFRNMLTMLRWLSPHWGAIERDLTEAEWTAFRALAKAGAVEGIIYFRFTDAGGEERVEHHHVRGEYTAKGVMGEEAMIRTDREQELRLVQVRLTSSGEWWQGMLVSAEGGGASKAGEVDEQVGKVRAVVLSMVERRQAEPERGHASLVPVPEPAPTAPGFGAVTRKSQAADAGHKPAEGDHDYAGLADELAAIEPGRKQAHQYEALVQRILVALFSPHLSNPVAQQAEDGKLRHVDITFSNKANSGFFCRPGSQLGLRAPYILFECKNYREDPANPGFDQLRASLGDSGKPQVGFLVCRRLENPDRALLRCQAKYPNVLMMTLQDEDLISMLGYRKRDDVEAVWNHMDKQLRRITMKG